VLQGSPSAGGQWGARQEQGGHREAQQGQVAGSVAVPSDHPQRSRKGHDCQVRQQIGA